MLELNNDGTVKNVITMGDCLKDARPLEEINPTYAGLEKKYGFKTQVLNKNRQEARDEK